MIDLSLRDNPGSAATPIRVILSVLMLAVFTIKLGFGILLPQLPALVERLLGADTTSAQMARATGLLTAIYMLGLFICAPVWGWLSDTWGRRRILLLGLSGFSATMTASVLSDTLAAIYVGRALTGIFAAAITPVALRLSRICRRAKRHWAADCRSYRWRASLAFCSVRRWGWCCSACRAAPGV